MKRILIFCGLICFVAATNAYANSITLSAPDTKGGKPLMEVLSKRQTNREFASTPLDLQTLSNLLYAAAGQNRSDGKLTYPTARDSRNMRVVVVMPQGAYNYDPKSLELSKITDTDLRPILAVQLFVTNAPITLLYIADLSKSNEAYSAMHAGSMYQNASLFCASVGLNNVVRGLFPADKIAKELNLPKNEKIIVTQTIGFPPKEKR